MSFKEFLKEDVPWHYENSGEGLTSATFLYKGTTYQVNIAGKNSLSISFSTKTNNGNTMSVLGNLNNSIVVFRTVLSIVYDYLNKHKNVTAITFSSKKHHKSRLKLYDYMAKLIKKKLGWNLDIDDSQSNEVSYTLERDQ